MFPAHSPYSPENQKMSRSHNCHNFLMLRKHIKTGLQKNIFSMFQELSQALRWHRFWRFDRSRCFWCQDRERFKSFQEAFSQCLKLGVYEDSAFYCWFTFFQSFFHLSCVATCSCVAGVISLWVRLLAVILDDLDPVIQDHANREQIIPLLRYHSSKSGEAEQLLQRWSSLSWLKSAEDMVGLDEYVSRMKPGGVFLHSTS